VLCAISIVGYFRLSAAARTLRSSVTESVPGRWDKQFEVHVGGLTLKLVRSASRCFKLPPEAKAALAALRGAEVGIYRLPAAPAALDYSTMFAAADESMKRRGWERIVGVGRNRQVVLVYLPSELRAAKRIACCVAVLNEQDLVVASARGNLEPLLEVAARRLQGDDLLLANAETPKR